MQKSPPRDLVNPQIADEKKNHPLRSTWLVVGSAEPDDKTGQSVGPTFLVDLRVMPYFSAN